MKIEIVSHKCLPFLNTNLRLRLWYGNEIIYTHTSPSTHTHTHTHTHTYAHTHSQDAFNEFHVLEDRITYVATKVVHLGDQLESSNNRRMRAIEAQELMKILSEFERKTKPMLPVFTDPARVCSPIIKP